MNKFDMKYVESEFGNYVCFNKEKWTSKDVIEKAKGLLDSKNELIVEEGYVQYGIIGVNDLEYLRKIAYMSSSLDEIGAEVPEITTVWIIRESDEIRNKFSVGDKVKINLPYDLFYHGLTGTISQIFMSNYVVNFGDKILSQVFKEERLEKITENPNSSI